jgi:hypothetical protein
MQVDHEATAQEWVKHGETVELTNPHPFRNVSLCESARLGGFYFRGMYYRGRDTYLKAGKLRRLRYGKYRTGATDLRSAGNHPSQAPGTLIFTDSQRPDQMRAIRQVILGEVQSFLAAVFGPNEKSLMLLRQLIYALHDLDRGKFVPLLKPKKVSHRSTAVLTLPYSSSIFAVVSARLSAASASLFCGAATGVLLLRND